MGVVVKEKASPKAEIYQSSIFPYEESHRYALHLNTHASSELFTPLHLTAQLIWEALV